MAPLEHARAAGLEGVVSVLLGPGASINKSTNTSNASSTDGVCLSSATDWGDTAESSIGMLWLLLCSFACRCRQLRAVDQNDMVH